MVTRREPTLCPPYSPCCVHGWRLWKIFIRGPRGERIFLWLSVKRGKWGVLCISLGVAAPLPQFPHISAGVKVSNPQDSKVLRRCVELELGRDVDCALRGPHACHMMPPAALPALCRRLRQQDRQQEALWCRGEQTPGQPFGSVPLIKSLAFLWP